MDKEDAEKIAFITLWGVYYYKMMPFGLKNAVATYMRDMTTIFHDMIHKEIDVYVDNVIIKSKRAADDIADLRKFFDRLRRFNLKLNPEKCAFWVPAGKLLGLIINCRGIELDLSKVKAIQELSPPMSKKDVMSFLGRLNYISRFIAQSTVICEPIFKMLGKDAETSWTEDSPLASSHWLFGMPKILSPRDMSHAKVQGEWATKNSKILPYLHHAQELRKRFTKIEFRHVPIIQNEFADAWDNLSYMIQHPDKNFINPIPVRIHNQPAYCAHIKEETDGKPWFHDIKEYLAKGEYPEHANHTQKWTLWRLSNHFFHGGGKLYRRTPNLGLLRCVDAKEASKLLEEIHDGTYDPHMNGFVLAKKILRVDYFWMTRETDCIQYVRKCYQCQVHADMIKVAAE
ncbi:uncharacterized protein [Nicotiana sylvestris]|uniref:uncharacterized protein n=1 Tax=Nicotiana sylvestris TaxID=4096 RepID=UPI00388C9CB8